MPSALHIAQHRHLVWKGLTGLLSRARPLRARQSSCADVRLAKYDDWYSAAHGWLLLEAQGHDVEASDQKRLALVPHSSFILLPNPFRSKRR